MTPKYLEKVSVAVQEGLLVINGNRILVELLEEEEKKTAGGIIIDAVKRSNTIENAERARVAVVLAVGPGYTVEDTGEKVPVPYAPGDRILVNHLGVTKFGEFLDMANYKPFSVGLITDDLVQGKLGNLEQLSAIFKK